MDFNEIFLKYPYAFKVMKTFFFIRKKMRSLHFKIQSRYIR